MVFRFKTFIFRYFFIPFTLLLSLLSFHTYGGISYHNIRVIHDLYLDEYKFLSPLYAQSLLETKYLEQLVQKSGARDNLPPKLIKFLFPDLSKGASLEHSKDVEIFNQFITSPETLGKFLLWSAQIKDTDLYGDFHPRFAKNFSPPNSFFSKDMTKLMSESLVDARLRNFYPRHFPELLFLAHYLQEKKGRDDILKLLKEISPLLVKDWEQKWENTGNKYDVSLEFSTDKEGQLIILEWVAKNNIWPLNPWAKKIKDEFKTQDLENFKKISIIMSNSDYPWGTPVSSESGAKFTRASFPSGQGEKLSRGWKDPSGLIWGDVVKIDSGSPQVVNHFEANKICLHIGARLPTREEFAKLQTYLGSQSEMGYIPQFLPHLAGHWYWSSTVYPSDPEFAYYLSGDAGDLQVGFRMNTKGYVRCVSL